MSSRDVARNAFDLTRAIDWERLTGRWSHPWSCVDTARERIADAALDLTDIEANAPSVWDAVEFSDVVADIADAIETGETFSARSIVASHYWQAMTLLGAEASPSAMAMHAKVSGS